MDELELAIEMKKFINETGQYNTFLGFMEDKGFDRNDLENDMEKIED